MPAPKAVGAVVAVPGSVIRRDYGPAAMAADKGFFSGLFCSVAGHVVLRAIKIRQGKTVLCRLDRVVCSGGKIRDLEGKGGFCHKIVTFQDPLVP